MIRKLLLSLMLLCMPVSWMAPAALAQGRDLPDFADLVDLERIYRRMTEPDD